MSETLFPSTPVKKNKGGRPRVHREPRIAAKDMLSETVACRVTKSDNIAIQFTAHFFGLGEADWIRTILLANVIQQGKPLPVLPTPPTPVVEGVQL